MSARKNYSFYVKANVNIADLEKNLQADQKNNKRQLDSTSDSSSAEVCVNKSSLAPANTELNSTLSSPAPTTSKTTKQLRDQRRNKIRQHRKRQKQAANDKEEKLKRYLRHFCSIEFALTFNLKFILRFDKIERLLACKYLYLNK